MVFEQGRADKVRVLVVIGDCLSVNSSANLCHLAYLTGLLAAGCAVDLLCAKDESAKTDAALTIPREITTYTYGVSLYEKLSHAKHHAAHENAAEEPAPQPEAPESHSGGLLSGVKASVRSLYGVYGPSRAWYNRAKHFTSEVEYDYVLSVSWPPISHLTAYTLIQHQQIRCKKWIQIWEDPWSSDISDVSDILSRRKEEAFLCSVAEDIVYVSPVTLAYQKELFPESAHKMRFVPVPSYYGGGQEPESFDTPVYGYFGDYVPEVRNLKPFYEAAVKEKAEAYICGNPAGLFPSTDTVSVHGRMSREDLRFYEEKANVLVFLCNRKGGQIPGKIYQYSATGRLILFLLDGTEREQAAIRAYFEPFGRYIFCENKIEAIQKAMEAIKGGAWRDTARAMDDFSSSKIIEQILR